jgi:hypothetical protein
MVLDAANIKSQNNKNLVINEWNGTTSQKFTFKFLSGSKYKIYSSLNSKD